MYAACTSQLAHALGSPFLLGLPRVAAFVALLAWLAAFLGLLGRVWRAATPASG
jgi:hypothetical protein